jgi:Cu+-exporting ATPase
MDNQDHTKASGCCGCGGGKAARPVTAAAVRDPVCGMSVDPAASRQRADHEGTTYHFCCGGCRAKFQADPSQYLAHGFQPSPIRFAA